MAIALPQQQKATRRYKVTPRLADSWAKCPLQTMTSTAGDKSWSLAWGNAIHDLLKLDGRRRLEGYPTLDAEELVVQGTPGSPWHDDNEYMELALACVTGLRRFLVEHELETLCVEEFVRSTDRDIEGVPEVKVYLSGRIDFVGRRRDGEMVFVDIKTGSRIPTPLEFAVLPSTFIYTYLAWTLRSQNRLVMERCTSSVEVMQVLPHKQEWTCTQLLDDGIAAGRAFVRQMVLDLGVSPK